MHSLCVLQNKHQPVALILETFQGDWASLRRIPGRVSRCWTSTPIRQDLLPVSMGNAVRRGQHDRNIASFFSLARDVDTFDEARAILVSFELEHCCNIARRGLAFVAGEDYATWSPAPATLHQSKLPTLQRGGHPLAATLWTRSRALGRCHQFPRGLDALSPRGTDTLAACGII